MQKEIHFLVAVVVIWISKDKEKITKLTFFELAVLSREGPGECIYYSAVWAQRHFWFRHFYVIFNSLPLLPICCPLLHALVYSANLRTTLFLPNKNSDKVTVTAYWNPCFPNIFIVYIIFFVYRKGSMVI